MLVHRGKGVNAPPALILVRPVNKVKPGAVGRILTLASAGSGIEAVAVEVAADIADMVEHAVQHHPHAPLVGHLAQLGKVLLGAQHGVNVAVIGGTVAVVLRRLKDGAEIQGLHPQALEIVQLLHDALQVAAEEVPVADLSVLVRAELRLLLPGSVDPPSSHHTLGIGHPGAAEAVGENLVGRPLAKPFRHHLSPVVDGELVGAEHLPPLSVQPLQTKGVPDQSHIVPRVQGTGKQIPGSVQPRPGHIQGDGGIVPELEAGGHGSP